MAETALDAGAFDPLAAGYDEAFTERPPARLLRELVWSRLESHVQPGGWALDLGCGTGEDAMWLARMGCHVTAVDGSPLMLELTARKAARSRVGGRVETQAFDLNEPRALGGPYQFVISNFGAFNCALDLYRLGKILGPAVAPGGVVAIVAMGRFCAWETCWYGVRLRATAVRRWRGHASANIGNYSAPVRYWSPSQLGEALGPCFRLRSVHPVGFFLPPSELFPFVERHPRLYAKLAKWETRAGSWGPLAFAADHHLTILQREAAGGAT